MSPDQRPPAPAEQTQTAPLHRRSFFWVIVGMVLGILIMALASTCRVPLRTAEPAPTGLVNPTELLDIQRAYNKGLEEELKRLQAALQQDPCTLPEVLGASPEQAPTGPGYARPQIPGTPGSPTDSSGKGPQGPGGAGIPLLESKNGTAPGLPPMDNRNGTAPAPTAAPAPSTVSELMDQATVFILAITPEGAAMGSGFFVAPGVIATNRHVVQQQGATLLAGNKILGGMHPAKLLAISNDPSRDYALLSLDGAAGRVPVLQIAPRAGRTERVSAWGFPGLITEADPKLTALINGDIKAVPEVVYSEGVVSVVLERTPPFIMHTAPISQGNSGGPLINSQGVVVGINTLIRTSDKSYSQASIALPGSDLALFMKEHGVQASTQAQ